MSSAFSARAGGASIDPPPWPPRRGLQHRGRPSPPASRLNSAQAGPPPGAPRPPPSPALFARQGARFARVLKKIYSETTGGAAMKVTSPGARTSTVVALESLGRPSNLNLKRSCVVTPAHSSRNTALLTIALLNTFSGSDGPSLLVTSPAPFGPILTVTSTVPVCRATRATSGYGGSVIASRQDRPSPCSGTAFPQTTKHTKPHRTAASQTVFLVLMMPTIKISYSLQPH